MMKVQQSLPISKHCPVCSAPQAERVLEKFWACLAEVGELKAWHLHFNRRGCGQSYWEDFEEGCKEIGFADAEDIERVFHWLKLGPSDPHVLMEMSRALACVCRTAF